MKNLFKIVMALILLFGAYLIIDAIMFEFAWKVEVINPSANVREEPNIHSQNIYTVARGGQFEVIDIYLDDPIYVWYHVKINNSKIGWIANPRGENPTLKEINNPKQEEYGLEEIDYDPPVLRFFNETYEVLNIDSIDYKHLDITDDSDFEVSHNVYIEENSKEVDYTQYFIEYIATDIYDNTIIKVQEIIFTEPPLESQVKDISELKNR